MPKKKKVAKAADGNVKEPAKPNPGRDRWKKNKLLHTLFEYTHIGEVFKHYREIEDLYEKGEWDSSPPTIGGGRPRTEYNIKFSFAANAELTALLGADEAEVACFECKKPSRVKLPKCGRCGIFVCNDCILPRCCSAECCFSDGVETSRFQCRGCGTRPCRGCSFELCFDCCQISVTSYDFTRLADHECADWQ